MNAKYLDRKIILFFLMAFMFLILTACETVTTTPYPNDPSLLPMATQQISQPCESCAQATLAAARTQEKNAANNQAAGTAEIVRANAQATLNSANTTLSAAQTQDQNNANIIAAQTQSQYNLQGTNVAGTQSVYAMFTQQNKNDLAAGTQTAIANNIATQTQVAVATSQWYTDQTRQREEQRQGPIAFLWMWCLPIFIVLLAGIVLWGFWRWLRIQQANQHILENPADKLPPPAVEVENHRHVLPYLDSDFVENSSQLTTPDDEVHDWLDDVKSTLLENEEKDEDDNSDN
jgi:hypothetical protein